MCQSGLYNALVWLSLLIAETPVRTPIAGSVRFRGGTSGSMGTFIDRGSTDRAGENVGVADP